MRKTVLAVATAVLPDRRVWQHDGAGGGAGSFVKKDPVKIGYSTYDLQCVVTGAVLVRALAFAGLRRGSRA